jgi:hypothetical protein
MAGGATMAAAGRGMGTMRRGAGAAGSGGAAGLAAAAAGAAAGLATGGATATVGRGAAAADSACLLARMALAMSPGFLAPERSIFGLATTAALAGAAGLDEPESWRRTFSATSSSMELECVSLLGDANRFECIENGVALEFQFPCKIVDANFAHRFPFQRPA